MNFASAPISSPSVAMPRYSSPIELLLLLLMVFTSASQSGLQQPKNDPPILKQQTQVVSLNVTVTDSNNLAVSELQQKDFVIYENNIEQQIEYFSQVDSPVSIGIVFDLSSSIASKLERAKDTVQSFISTSHPDDEYFLVTFNQKARLATDMTDSNSIINSIRQLSAGGNTALYDAVYLGSEKLKEARHSKKALLVVSDGQDNCSRYNLRDLIKQIKETDLIIYCVSLAEVQGGNCGQLCQINTHRVLEDIASITGGRAFFPSSFEEVENNIAQIALELRQQYSIGYISTNSQRDGKWRKVSVRVRKEVRLKTQTQRIIIRAKQGYFTVP